MADTYTGEDNKERADVLSQNAAANENKSFSKLISAFPRSSTTPNLNSNSSDTVGVKGSSAAIDRSIKIMEKLAPVTRFAFIDLLVTVLRLDFYREDERATKFYASTIELILEWSELPEKTKSTLRQYEDHVPFDKDISELIIAVRMDPFLIDEGTATGTVALIGSLLIHILQKDGKYDSRYRVFLRHISALLGVDWERVEEFEDTLTNRLIEEFTETEAARETREKLQKFKKYRRYAMIGAASGVGGVIIGITGGLAAPLVAAGIGTLTASTVLAGLSTTVGAAIFGGVFGAAGAGLSGYRMKKRVGAIEEFVIERLTDEGRISLHCVLCVSGFISENDDAAFRRQWRHLWHGVEQYTLRWESRYLEDLGKAIDYFVSYVVTFAIQRSLMETALAGLVTAIAWPLALIGSSSLIDNPWNICTSRATEVGEHLAEVLLSRAHGRKPITLVGFSLGARVIYHCLLAMSRRGDTALGIVEDVVLLGAPVSASPKQWRQIASIVGGRVINGYCGSDWLLRFLYRMMNIQFAIAGTGPIDAGERKIVNYNLSHIVKGHMDYAKKLTQILDAIGVKVTPLSKASIRNLEALDPGAKDSFDDHLKLDEASEVREKEERIEDREGEIVDDADGLLERKPNECPLGLTLTNHPPIANNNPPVKFCT